MIESPVLQNTCPKRKQEIHDFVDRLSFSRFMSPLDLTNLTS
jgi:hypothetical protein